MSDKSERARSVVALLAASCTLLVQAENEGQNESALLKASIRARKIITAEIDRQLDIFDAERGIKRRRT